MSIESEAKQLYDAWRGAGGHRITGWRLHWKSLSKKSKRRWLEVARMAREIRRRGLQEEE